jgi:hypothetical protein
MSQYSSCSYRLVSKCGYPKIYYYSSVSTSNEFDIIYSTQEGIPVYDDSVWDINRTSPQAGSFIMKFDPKSSNIKRENFILQKGGKETLG